MNFADAYAILLITGAVIASWEGIIKPLINFIILQLFGVTFVVAVYYGDPNKKPAYMKEYAIRAHSHDDAIIKGLKAFKNDWVSKSDKIPLSSVNNVVARDVG